MNIPRSHRRRLGEALLEAGLVTRDQLEEAVARQRHTHKRLGEELIDMGLLNEHDVTEVLARLLGFPFIELSGYKIDPAVARVVPELLARRYRLLPINKVGHRLTVAMGDPLNVLATDEIKLLTGLTVRAVVSVPSAINGAIEEVYGTADHVATILQGLDHPQEGDLETIEVEEIDENAGPIIRLVDAIIRRACESKVSDIHIEPYEDELRVRYRLDGVLTTTLRPPRRAHAAIVSRIKILAEMDIAEKRLPQDGRIKLRIDRRTVDFRVSTIPTSWGEKVVIRILDQAGLRVDLGELGFEAASYDRFRRGLESPHGILLVTGPTGSGKTTTLYSAMSTLNREGVNIITAEDPIEYQIKGINQVQCRADIGLSFAHALRSFLRQDPDVIMVGEIRDAETAEIAVKASMTGHLVLSTIHTNDAPSTISRLVEMGVETFLVTSSVLVIQAQRLVRLICRDCRRESQPRPELLDGLAVDAKRLAQLDLPHLDPATLKLSRGEGCDACSGAGYRGRIGVYEVMEMTEDLRQLIMNGGSTTAIARHARDSGMLTLRDSAISKCLLGLTSAEEVVRVTAADR